MTGLDDPKAWGSRIRWIVDRYSEGNQSEFARKVGISQQSVNRLYRGRRIPSAPTLAAIVEAWPEISALWLLTGKGPRVRVPEDEAQVVGEVTGEIGEVVEKVRRRYGVD